MRIPRSPNTEIEYNPFLTIHALSSARFLLSLLFSITDIETRIHNTETVHKNCTWTFQPLASFFFRLFRTDLYAIRFLVQQTTFPHTLVLISPFLHCGYFALVLLCGFLHLVACIATVERGQMGYKCMDGGVEKIGMDRGMRADVWKDACGLYWWCIAHGLWCRIRCWWLHWLTEYRELRKEDSMARLIAVAVDIQNFQKPP